MWDRELEALVAAAAKTGASVLERKKKAAVAAMDEMTKTAIAGQNLVNAGEALRALAWADKEELLPVVQSRIKLLTDKALLMAQLAKSHDELVTVELQAAHAALGEAIQLGRSPTKSDVPMILDSVGLVLGVAGLFVNAPAIAAAGVALGIKGVSKHIHERVHSWESDAKDLCRHYDDAAAKKLFADANTLMRDFESAIDYVDLLRQSTEVLRKENEIWQSKLKKVESGA